MQSDTSAASRLTCCSRRQQRRPIVPPFLVLTLAAVAEALGSRLLLEIRSKRIGDRMSDSERMSEERVNGGCEGPDAMFVKLISSDGHEFIIKREHALTSGTIKAMLSGPGESAAPWLEWTA